VFRTDLDALGDDEFEPGDADKAEHGAQIGLGVLGGGGRRAGSIEVAARNGDNHPLVAGQAFDALRGISEGLARDENPVDPGLELAGHREIIHRRPDHHDVGGEELFEQRLAQREIGLEGGIMRTVQPAAGDGHIGAG